MPTTSIPIRPREEATLEGASVDQSQVRQLKSEDACTPPQCSACSGDSSQACDVPPGFWSPDGRRVYRCPLRSACLGGVASSCANGHLGPMCAACVKGYFQGWPWRRAESCEPCEPTGFSVAI